MVTAAQQDFFKENGYVGPFSLIDTAPLENLLRISRTARSEGLFSRILRKAGLAADRRLNSREGHVNIRQICDVAMVPDLLDNLEDLLGPDILLWTGQVAPRPPGSLGQGWHIDRTNQLVEGVHVTVALTSMTREKSCFQLIPGTHKYDISLQESARQGQCNLQNGESVARLADALHPERAPHKVVEMELQAGQYFFTKGGLWHAVPKNSTNETRFALTARYMRPDKASRRWTHDDSEKQVVNEESRRCILVRGNDNFALNRLYQIPRAVPTATRFVL